MVDFLQAGAGNISELVGWSRASNDSEHSGACISELPPTSGDVGRFSGKNYNSTMFPAEGYSKCMSIIRKAAGSDFYLLASSGPIFHNAGYVDAVRTGPDLGEGRQVRKDSPFYPATSEINSMLTSCMGPHRALVNQAGHYYTHRKLYQNDSGNVLTVDKPLALEQARIHATIHALSGSSTILGDDIRRIDESRLDLIKKTLPRPTDVAIPVDLFEPGSEVNPHVFMRKIVQKSATWHVVAFYNFTKESVTYTQSFDLLRISANGEYHAWEFWNDQYLGCFSEELSISVPSMCVRVVRLTKACNHPVVVGTDMHVLMGEVDLENTCWDAESLTLSGKSLRPDGERGNIFIHSACPLMVDNDSDSANSENTLRNAASFLTVKNIDDCYISKDAVNNCLIIRVQVEGSQSWRLNFKILHGDNP